MNLVAARLDRGLSPTRAAQEIGISRGTLKKAESGSAVHPALAKKIADFYDTTVTEIWPLEPESAAA